MSGGSFDYLCHQDCELSSFTHQIVHMRDQLRRDGYEDAAQRTDDVLRHLEHAQRIAQELNDVWKAMEWWKSNDWSQEVLKLANAKLHQVAAPEPSKATCQRATLQRLQIRVDELLETFPYAES